MIDFNKQWVSMKCPKCGYEDEVQLVDVKSEKTVFCHNCKMSIRLVDGTASVHQGIETMNKAMKELENVFKTFGK